MSNEAKALVAGHAEFAQGLVSAAVQITGQSDVFVTMTNTEMSADEIEKRMRSAVTEYGITVIFTDLPAGSCTIAARRILRDDGQITMVTGANLAALLHFMSHGEITSFEAASGAADRAKGSILVVSAAGGR
jgi:PTS system N-acetylgalactosamine-specific IIA component